MPAVNGEKMNAFGVREENQGHFTLYNFITLQKLIIQKHEVIVHYVICFSTALIHSHTRQPLPCLNRKESTPLCLSALPFITHCFFSSSPSQVLFPGKWQRPLGSGFEK